MPRRGAFALLAVVLATVVACSAILDERLSVDPPGAPGVPGVPPVVVGTAPPGPGGEPSSAPVLPPPDPAATALPTRDPRPTPRPSQGPATSQAPSPNTTVGTGSDGRLTVLLLGSDKRENVVYLGERTDVVLVASIVPSTKRITLASVSRGAIRWPIAPGNRTKWRGASNSGGTKLSEIYQKYYPRFDAKKVMPVHSGALDRLKADVAYGLGIEIDYWAFIRFSGFTALIDHVGGLKVSIPARIIDPYFMSDPRRPGIHFPAARGYPLQGNPTCSAYPAHCHSALVYARSRKGTVGTAKNGGDKRAIRQQQLTMTAIRKVIGRGADDDLVALLAASEGRVTTNLPHAWEDVLHLYELLRGAKSASSDKAIFFPPAWGIQTMSASGFADLMNITAMRGWCDVHFAPVRG